MLLRQLFEEISRTGQGKTAVIGWGRGMGHKGHMMLASSVITKAKSVGGDPYFVVSRTMGKDDPLSADEKLAIYKKVFPEKGHIFQAASDEMPDLTRVLSNLNQQGYTNAFVVVGADQVNAFQYLKNYNGKPNKAGDIPFKFDSLEVISRQETGDPSAGEEGPRATPMRNILNDPNATPEQQFQVWRDAMSPQVSDDEVRQLMAKAKERMAQFSAPKKKEKKVAEKMLPPSVFAGYPKNKLGPAAHLKGSMKRPARQGDLVGGAEESVEEGWKSALAGAALAGASMLGGLGHAQAADLSGYNTQYLQSVVKGEHSRPMVSVDDAKKELELRAQGKQQAQAPDAPKDHIGSLNKQYTPGVESLGTGRDFSYKGKEYTWAGRTAVPPEADGEIIVVPAGYVGIRGLGPTKVMLGSDGKYYKAPASNNESKLVPLSEDIENIMGSIIKQLINK